MTTAGDQINGALRLIGKLAEGETPSAETSADALSAMNQMLDSWSTENLMIFSTQDQSFTWPGNTPSRTLGPTGNFVGNRPVALSPDPYFKDATSGISFGLTPISQAQYDAIAIKTLTSTYPQTLFVNMDMPNITLFAYPVPSRDLEFHFISVNELTQPATLATNFVFPPGYLRAFKFNLACEIAAEFGMEPPPNVLRIAATTKRVIKRANVKPEDLVMDLPSSVVRQKQKASIFVGGYW